MDPFKAPGFLVCEKTHNGSDGPWTCKALRLADSDLCWNCESDQACQFVNSPWTQQGGFEMFAHITAMHIAHLEEQIKRLFTPST